MFDYALPDEALVAAANKGGKNDGDKGKNDKKKDDKGKGGGGVQTQMVGEKPGDDLGYDPKKIPVEDIPDD